MVAYGIRWKFLCYGLIGRQMKASRRGFFGLLGLGASAVAAKASPVIVIETPKRLNLNRGKPGSVLHSLESSIKEMINREAKAIAAGEEFIAGNNDSEGSKSTKLEPDNFQWVNPFTSWDPSKQ